MGKGSIHLKQKGMAGIMEREERWNQFAVTGKVMDYLEYRKSAEAWRNSTAEGNREHERDCGTYRDDINSISDERVR